MSSLQFDASELYQLAKELEADTKSVNKIVRDTLRSEGYDAVNKSIRDMLPASGRTWPSRRTAPASSVDPFEEIDEVLGFTIKSTHDYGYLYFPDDGSNTERHAGNQGFMEKGAESVMDDLMETLTDKIMSVLT